ncbi:MAG TPA: hypothetical protein VM870_06695 [Pyrinomonadaceae bacterium]|nr:hypothetical protein [Pyrinomonadaceae bacterium]
MNRKLIRPTLAEIKEKGRETPPKEQVNGDSSAPAARSVNTGGGAAAVPTHQQRAPPAGTPAPGGAPAPPGTSAGRSKRVPPSETFAEIFYYKKQMDAHTPMIIVLQDGEEIEGTIEWYDRDALKINRRSAPNILLLKHNIKYMYKAEERETK